MNQRKIIHVDMDCFYAAVEVKYRPELRGLPVGIGGPPNSRSVLCTANYEARKYGVRSAMPSSKAVRLCPHLVLLPPNFELYKKESEAVREIFSRFTDKIEPLSLDEAYLDVRNQEMFRGSATLMAREIRKMIYYERGLTASAGIAPNKFLAKIASDWNKPNGQFAIRPDDIEQFVKNLEVEKLYGVGKVTAKRMHELGLHTCADIQRAQPEKLKRFFGVRATELFSLAHGEDHREVETQSERKSLTVEETFNQDLISIDDMTGRLPELYADWTRRMQKIIHESTIRGIVIKIKYHDFKVTTHEMAFSQWPAIINFKQLLERAWRRRPAPVRLIGLGARLGKMQSDPNLPQLKFSIES